MGGLQTVLWPPNLPTVTDALPDDITTGIHARDPDAFGACYEALADPLFRYLLSNCGDRELAADLVEATFLELVEQAPRLSGGVSGVRAWLFRAGKNNLLDEVRKRRRRGDLPLDERRAVTRESRQLGPEELAVQGSEAERMHVALEQVSADQREVLLLRFAGELSGPEIAELTGRTVGAVKALQHRGLRALERVLQAMADQADEASGPAP